MKAEGFASFRPEAIEGSGQALAVLDSSRLIVDSHDGDETGMGAQLGEQGLGKNPPIGIGIDVADFEAQSPEQFGLSMDGSVLNRGYEDMRSRRTACGGCEEGEQRYLVGFRA
jgi:hypothetical protein